MLFKHEMCMAACDYPLNLIGIAIISYLFVNIREVKNVGP